MKNTLQRVVGFYFVVDGLLTTIFGRRYIGLYDFGPALSPYRKTIQWIMARSSWLQRSAGFSEFLLGIFLLSRSPLDVQTFYRAIARGYAAIDPVWRKKFYPEAHESFDHALQRYLPQGGRVLDLGCGVGGNLARLLDLHLPFGSYMGVDLTYAMLWQAQKRYQRVSHVRFQQMDLMTDPLPEGQFDLITSTWVFEHLRNPFHVVRKAWDRLAPGGHVVLLFEASADTIFSKVTDKVYPFFSAWRVSEDEIQKYPGISSDQRYHGPLGDLALVVLEKPRE